MEKVAVAEPKAPAEAPPALKEEAPATEGNKEAQNKEAPASGEQKEQKEQKRREPEKVNSRAAAFGGAPAARGNQVRPANVCALMCSCIYI